MINCNQPAYQRGDQQRRAAGKIAQYRARPTPKSLHRGRLSSSAAGPAAFAISPAVPGVMHDTSSRLVDSTDRLFSSSLSSAQLDQFLRRAGPRSLEMR